MIYTFKPYSLFDPHHCILSSLPHKNHIKPKPKTSAKILFYFNRPYYTLYSISTDKCNTSILFTLFPQIHQNVYTLDYISTDQSNTSTPCNIFIHPSNTSTPLITCPQTNPIHQHLSLYVNPQIQ